MVFDQTCTILMVITILPRPISALKCRGWQHSQSESSSRVRFLDRR